MTRCIISCRVQQRELLRPPQVPDVRPELGLTFDEVSQVSVGQGDPAALALVPRDLDVLGGQLVADAA
jgi:hypothetical protein